MRELFLDNENLQLRIFVISDHRFCLKIAFLDFDRVYHNPKISSYKLTQDCNNIQFQLLKRNARRRDQEARKEFQKNKIPFFFFVFFSSNLL